MLNLAELTRRSTACMCLDVRVWLLLVRVHATLLITPLQMAVRGPAEDVGWKLICPESRTPEVTSQSERLSANPERSSAPKHGGGVEANPAAAATSRFIL